MKNLLSYWPLSFMFRKIVTAKEEREEKNNETWLIYKKK